MAVTHASPSINGRPASATGVNDFVASLGLPHAKAEKVVEALTLVDPTAALHSTQNGTDTAKRGEAACNVAQIVLGSSTLSNRTEITPVIEETWSQTCWQFPNCVVRPKNAEEVSKILRIVNFCKARFAVRSGGHSPNPGASSISDGILIDLHLLNGISIDDSRKVASIGPGARWGDVYAFLDSYDVTVVGGRVPQVGVGGLVLGGGLSYYSGEYGLAADNVESFEVVLADGRMVTASRDQESNLFWALKGGGPNFGIVTGYNIHTIPVKNIWYTMSIYSLDQASTILDAFAAWQSSNTDPKASVVFYLSLQAVTLGLIYNEHAERPAAFQQFYALPPALMTAVPESNGTAYILNQITAAGSTGQPTAPRHDYRGVSSKVDAELYKQIYQHWFTAATAAQQSTGANCTFVMQHIPQSLVEKGNENGGNPLGLENIPQLWWTTIADWQNAADDDAVRSVAISTTEKWEELSKARGSHLAFKYMNDASRDENPLASYPAVNLARLKSIAATYDPAGVFQTLQNGGFLLSKA